MKKYVIYLRFPFKPNFFLILHSELNNNKISHKNICDHVFLKLEIQMISKKIMFSIYM